MKTAEEIDYCFSNVRASIGYSNDYQTNIADKDLNSIQMEISRLRKVEEAVKELIAARKIRHADMVLAAIEKLKEVLDWNEIPKKTDRN